MATFPNSKKARLEKVEALLTPWAANATQIGLSTTQMTTLTSRTTTARTKFNEMIAKRLASQAATIEWYTAFGSMDDIATDYNKTIRAFAETTNNDNVYALAQIPAPKTPSPIGPPDAPINLISFVTTAGTVDLSWVGSVEGATVFIVERQTTPLTGSPAAWMSIGVASEKKFTDANVPQGVAAVSYRITAQRPAGSSNPSESSTVNFGTAPTSSGTSELKIAA